MRHQIGQSKRTKNGQNIDPKNGSKSRTQNQNLQRNKEIEVKQDGGPRFPFISFAYFNDRNDGFFGAFFCKLGEGGGAYGWEGGAIESLIKIESINRRR